MGNFISHLPSTLAVFLIGVVLMSYSLVDPHRPRADLGVPGNDSFYHIRMASMLSEVGVLREFPWLKQAYFTSEGDRFVSHHFGYHVLLAPFVRVAEKLTGDGLAGGRWATSFFFGLNLALYYLLLRLENVRAPWLWMLLYLLQPMHFFTRHAFVRAIGPSLTCMLLLLLTMFRGRTLLASVVTALYTQLYLGGVLYGPVIVGSFVLACIIGPVQDRAIPWRLVGWVALGWVVGVITYPYAGGTWDFLKLQVFGSGLSPDVGVGREWNPYENVWWFAWMSGAVLITWAIAVIARCRFGPSLSAKECCLLILHFGFLALTFKARRFIEYWPPFALLSAATLIRPVLDTLADAVRRQVRRIPRAELWSSFSALLCGAVVIFALSMVSRGSPQVAQVARDWPTWTALASVYLLAAIRPTRETAVQPLAFLRNGVVGLVVVVAAGVIIAGCLAYGFGGLAAGSPIVHTGLGVWVALALLTFLSCGAGPRRIVSPNTNASHPPRAFTFRTVRQSVGAVVVSSAATCFAGPVWREVQRSNRCQYDLPEIRRFMDFVIAHSLPGDVVFTDDWDVFPVYFYHNTHNHYLVGLDPAFTHHREPELWQRYVRISRGQVPAMISVERNQNGNERTSAQARVSLDDIRNIFGARFVITDADHRPLAERLAARPDFARLIYPSNSFAESRNASYLIFEILREPELSPTESAVEPEEQIGTTLFLDRLPPKSVVQGWGELALNRSVDGGLIRLSGRMFGRGLGTHAPSRIVFEIPPGFDEFEATVGIDDATDGRGSVSAQVILDDETVFQSGVLRGAAGPIEVQISLRGASKLVLQTEETEDGDHFDHVDWANARLIRAETGNRMNSNTNE